MSMDDNYEDYYHYDYLGLPRRNSTIAVWENSPYNVDAKDTSELAKMPRVVTILLAVVLIGYFVIGTSGNFLAIVALVRCPRVRNATSAFIISLCVADLLVCILVLPWEVFRFLAGKWVWGEGFICTVSALLRYWNVAASFLSIAMITINRYIMIAHFNVYKQVYRTQWITLMIAFCWIFAFVMLLPTLLGQWGRFGLNSSLQTCSIIEVNNTSPKKFLFGFGFCVPAVIIVICYSLIFHVIHRSGKRTMAHSYPTGNDATPQSAVKLQSRTPNKMDREVRRKRSEWKVTKMVLIIFIAFFITYLPITLVKNFDHDVKYPGLHLLSYVLAYVSSCINPIIYVIMNRQYRQAYKTVLLCRRPRLLSSDREKKCPPLREEKKQPVVVEEEEVQDKTLMSRLSEGETNLPECHELPDVFTDK